MGSPGELDGKKVALDDEFCYMFDNEGDPITVESMLEEYGKYM